jgi:2-C-methyl-D-erythritol 2,4-cyclodiphosphate synthase
MRVGHGYDVHQMVEERKLILGGVEIPYDRGLLGHSDADVLVHAIMDALFGAAAMGDIGRAFPDNDPAYENIDSMILLSRTLEMLRQRGWQVGNVDATIIAQRPKLMPYIPAMTARIAEVLEVEPDQVNVKATTEEKLGFTGRGEGISAHAVALIYRA